MTRWVCTAGTAEILSEKGFEEPMKFTAVNVCEAVLREGHQIDWIFASSTNAAWAEVRFKCNTIS